MKRTEWLHDNIIYPYTLPLWSYQYCMSQTKRTSKRGRPRTEVGHSNIEPREEILIHAARLFSRQGIGATKITDIGASIGVSSQSIYYHFRNLDEIAESLLDYALKEPEKPKKASKFDTYSERLQDYIKRHIEKLISGPYDLWFIVYLSDSEVRRFPAARKHASAWKKEAARIIQAGQKSGEFLEMDTHIAVDVLSGIVIGAMESHHRNYILKPEEYAQLMINGIRRID